MTRRRRQVLFIQGGGSGTHDHWDQALVRGLEEGLADGWQVQYPRMPGEGEPSFRTWSAAIGRAMTGLGDGAVLVGHSVGGTILLGTLAARPSPKPLGAIVLIAAPFVGEGGWPSDDLRLPDDLGISAGVPVHLFHGLADETVPPSHLDLYARALPAAHVHRLPGRDHQLNDDMREVSRVIRAT